MCACVCVCVCVLSNRDFSHKYEHVPLTSFVMDIKEVCVSDDLLDILHFEEDEAGWVRRQEDAEDPIFKE